MPLIQLKWRLNWSTLSVLNQLLAGDFDTSDDPDVTTVFATGFYVYAALRHLLLVKTRFNRFTQVIEARFSAGV